MGVRQVMVANIRCAEIMEDQLRALAEDQAWLALKQQAAAGLVAQFGTRVAALLDSCSSGVNAHWHTPAALSLSTGVMTVLPLSAISVKAPSLQVLEGA